MASTHEIKHLDRRTVARYLERGLVSQADYDKYLNQLPDLAGQAVPITVEQPGSEESEADEPAETAET